uniref:Kinesin motor domain-containing protein n=1 Tax=Toxocara canis TaxID=6265 RepID=A0A183VH92_TOXCA
LEWENEVLKARIIEVERQRKKELTELMADYDERIAELRSLVEKNTKDNAHLEAERSDAVAETGLRSESHGISARSSQAVVERLQTQMASFEEWHQELERENKVVWMSVAILGLCVSCKKRFSLIAQCNASYASP